MMDEVQRKGMGIQFNTLDIKPSDPFVLAGDVWLRCRAGELDPNRFGDSDTDIGMAPIRYALLHDFAALNGFEVLGNDDWGKLIRKPETAIIPDDLILLDQIATLTIHVDTHLDTLRTLFRHERNTLWTFHVFGPDDEIELQNVNVLLPVSAVYEDVFFENSDEAQ